MDICIERKGKFVVVQIGNKEYLRLEDTDNGVLVQQSTLLPTDIHVAKQIVRAQMWAFKLAEEMIRNRINEQEY